MIFLRDELLDHLRDATELVAYKKRKFAEGSVSQADVDFARGRQNGLAKAIELYDKIWEEEK